MFVRLDEVTKKFNDTVAVNRVSLRIEDGELFFLLGPSGCGKTTLLRLLAGFYQPDSGHIYFGELTFFHWSGLVPFVPPKWDNIFGDSLVLPR